MAYRTNDIYTIRCSKCSAHMGVCPGSQPMPSLYCTDCEDSIREEMERDREMSDQYRAALNRL